MCYWGPAATVLESRAFAPVEASVSDRFSADESTPLLAFLLSRLSGWSRSRVKKRLQAGCVLVNDEPTRQHDHLLRAGDRVEVLAKAKVPRGGAQIFEILYSGNGLVAIHKPAGLLSVAAAEEEEPNALALLRTQLSEGPGRMRLWPVHRLDRDTSGVLLFATSVEAKARVTRAWNEAEKTYLGIVEGEPKPAARTIDEPLRMDSAGFRALAGPHPGARRAVTHFETLRSDSGRSLLEIRIDTGRQHQIRAHLAYVGHPLVGDDRYGSGRGRLGLHAMRLSIPDPSGGDRLVFETDPPPDFLALMRAPRRWPPA